MNACEYCGCATDDDITIEKRSPEGEVIWSKRSCYDCAVEIMDSIE